MIFCHFNDKDTTFQHSAALIIFHFVDISTEYIFQYFNNGTCIQVGPHTAFGGKGFVVIFLLCFL